MTWTNCATVEVFRLTVHESGHELPEIIQEWIDLVGHDFLDDFARQLRADITSNFHYDEDDPHGRLTGLAMRQCLVRVDWRQLAERLVAYADEGHPRHLPNSCWCCQPMRSWPRDDQADVPILTKGIHHAKRF
jgi:hypothetical protein